MGVQRGREPQPRALGWQGLRRAKERGAGRCRRSCRDTSAPTSSRRRSGEACRSSGRPSRQAAPWSITVANGKLVGNMDGRGEQVLIATSDTEFAGLYGLGVEFIDGGKGGLYVKHVSGNYRFARK